MLIGDIFPDAFFRLFEGSNEKVLFGLKDTGLLYATHLLINIVRMNEYNFHNEIATNLKMFESAFDDTIIKRFDDMTGVFKDSIKVNYIYGPKTRILQDIKGQPDTVKLPIVAVTVTGMGRDVERVKNKIDDIVYKKSDDSYIRLKAIPWNITVEMNILTKYQSDLDQILQNFAVHTDPYIVFSWKEPTTGREMRTEVLWDGNVSVEYPAELENNKVYRVSAKANFTIKTWLFRSALTPVNKICKINTDYIMTSDFYCNYSDLTANVTAAQTDSYTLSGRPILRYVSPYFILEGSEPMIVLQGYNFENTTSLYVSAANINYPSTNNLNSCGEISSVTPSLGTLITEFTKSPNEISFKMPLLSGTTFVDIIAVNTCGYGKLTEDANRCNRVENPYPIDNPEHYNWCVLQFPYLNGLIISENHNTPIIDYTKQIIEISEEPTLDRDALIEKIRDLMLLGDINVSDLA